MKTRPLTTNEIAARLLLMSRAMDTYHEKFSKVGIELNPPGETPFDLALDILGVPKESKRHSRDNLHAIYEETVQKRGDIKTFIAFATGEREIDYGKSGSLSDRAFRMAIYK